MRLGVSSPPEGLVGVGKQNQCVCLLQSLATGGYRGGGGGGPEHVMAT